jgi:hypothetical protein
MRIAPLIAVAAAAALLAACAEGPGYSAGYGYDYPVAAVGYDGYYDDYYGPFYDGYWGADGGFYYRGSDHDRWHKDTGQHFRHEAAGERYHPVTGHPRAAPAQREEHHE